MCVEFATGHPCIAQAGHHVFMPTIQEFGVATTMAYSPTKASATYSRVYQGNDVFHRERKPHAQAGGRCVA